MKEYDLEIRTEQFASACRTLIRNAERDISNIEDCKQLARASGSTGANCIEANEGFTKKDRIFRFKTCRKEAKESRYFLRLIHLAKPELLKERNMLIDEATELVKIFSTIIKRIGDSDETKTT